MSSDLAVYTGPWVNWTKGSIRGGTLTLGLRDGSILVAFFALFVRLVGSHLWSIFCYVIHQLRSKQGNRDAFHHQHQTILRNASSVTTTLWLWLKVGWAWRSEPIHPFWRSLALVAISTLHIGAFVIAGLLASRGVITDSTVLLRSSYCGSWPIDDQFILSNFNNFNNKTPAVLQEEEAFAIEARRELEDSLAYVWDCYPVPGPDCARFISGALYQDISRNASCPFDKPLCLTDAVYIETDFIDSAVDLGINAKLEDRVWFRKSISCAVLSSDSVYTSSEVGPNSINAAFPDQNETFFYYGPSFRGHNFTASFSNYTYNGAYNYWYDLS